MKNICNDGIPFEFYDFFDRHPAVMTGHVGILIRHGQKHRHIIHEIRVGVIGYIIIFTV